MNRKGRKNKGVIPGRTEVKDAKLLFHVRIHAYIIYSHQSQV